MVTQEFQAIVLAAGRGTRLPEVLGDTPKCLLPIGPYPLIWYPLNLLQQHNFQECIVIVFESDRSDIQLALERCPLKMKLDFVTIPTDSDYGTADSLRFVADKIKTDFLILSCDIVSNVSLYPLINKFRQHDASMAAMFFKSGFESDVTLPGPKSKHKPERDLIGVHPDTKRFLLLASTSDFEEVMSVNAHLLRKNGKMTIYSRMVDSHIYVMKRWVLEFLQKKTNFTTLKGEFLPYLIKKQMSKTSANQSSSNPASDTQSELGLGSANDEHIFNFIPHSNMDQQILRTTLYNDSRTKPLYNADLLKCYALEAPKETIGVRVNTTLSFFAVNQKLSTIWPLICDGQDLPLVSPHAQVHSTQTKEIAVAENAKLSEKTSLNFSVFGPQCCINPKNIINKSLIMANALVEESCNIENCIIGPKAVVKKGTKLKNCLVGANFVVEEGSELESKHLTHSDGYMEIDIQ